MKKKLISGLLCATMASALFAGCGGSSETGSDASGESGSSAAGGTITIMASQDWIEDSEQELGAKFEEETGIHVDYQILPADQYQDVLLTRLNSGEGPDIFMAQSGFAIDTTYKVQENAVDLSNEPWMSTYSSFSAEQTSVDGKNYGMTYYDTTTDYYMIYNKKIMEAAGVTSVPTTFADFEAACQKIMDSGVTPIYEPVADGWHQTMLWTANAQVMDKEDPGIIDKLNNNETTFAENETMLTALTQLNDLAQKGYFGDNYLSDEFANAEGYLASGEYCMCFLKPGAIASIVANENNAGYTEDDFGIMLLPICDNQYLNVHPTGPSKFIYSGSANIDAAKQYLEYISSKDSIQYVIDNASDVENLPFDAGQTPEYSATTEEFLGSFDDATSGMVLQDVCKYYNEQWMDISANIASMFIGDMTPQEVLEAIDAGRAQLAEAAGDPNWQ
ncbi:ABC transporter substrate-binding protein [Pseudobutyrivibrio sp.]|jgi:raffinose/stachyose/melibiose transport system substrate-binding protein|uniref:ABC transporter substrate-binding protein n=1 Tax=Pseudobutyrivibrio sp. TaxID=2014367 RepID=UPI001DF48A05|nr:ABC transporter substrate-binding protein [Pseudobutyrivibrio sp.]MBE5910064.1 carbohydrate ABC transporter substrate-binding protein [Pseudobutyrivibrio sp.]